MFLDMRTKLFLIFVFVLTSIMLSTNVVSAETASPVVLPLPNYANDRFYLTYGQYVKDRFIGYHLGDDIEARDATATVPVVSIADGTVRHKAWHNGYGGLIIIQHYIDGRPYQSLYGHVSLASSPLKVGSKVSKGQLIANLGADKSQETDGEHKHLHFEVYPGTSIRIQGYTQAASLIKNWTNPQDFFSTFGLNVRMRERQYTPNMDRERDRFGLNFWIPGNMGIEYIPQIDALNIFDLSGQGPARERAQFLIFNLQQADPTKVAGYNVETFATSTLESGAQTTATRLTKTPVAPIANQPTWRAATTWALAVTSPDGSRHYLVIANPKQSLGELENLVASFKFK